MGDVAKVGPLGKVLTDQTICVFAETSFIAVPLLADVDSPAPGVHGKGRPSENLPALAPETVLPNSASGPAVTEPSADHPNAAHVMLAAPHCNATVHDQFSSTADSDWHKLQGEWKVVAMETDGEKAVEKKAGCVPPHTAI
jgi:hypothetical protein